MCYPGLHLGQDVGAASMEGVLVVIIGGDVRTSHQGAARRTFLVHALPGASLTGAASKHRSVNTSSVQSNNNIIHLD